MPDALRALLHVSRQGVLAASAAPAVFIRAEADPALRELLPNLVCEQTFKPEYDRLAALGCAVSRRAQGPCGTALCLLTKNKLENLANIARAWSMLDPGGLLICSGAKDSGAASIANLASAAFGEFETLSKYHCRVFWTRRRAGPMPAPAADWLASGELHVVPQTGYLSRPGIYGWNGIDEGSRLLAAHLPPDIAGRVADLGAGWGFLSISLLERCPNIASLDLYEAEWLALEAARANISARRHGASVGYHWHDVTAGLPAHRYDTIVMNPPFHSGKATDVALGRAFIAAAAAALVPGGTLLMVANRHLPYEAAVDVHLKARQTIAETAAFKLIRATAP
jgi:16S rRNA (guanine1207-N2)-methyltransferase